MKHLDNILIQKYIDGELAEKESQVIESHLADCASCRQKVDEQRAFSEKVKQSLEKSVPADVEIPPFGIKKEMVSKDRAIHIAIISSLSAACAVALLFLIISFFNSRTKPIEPFYDYYTIEEYDANKPFSEQKLALYEIKSQIQEQL